MGKPTRYPLRFILRMPYLFLWPAWPVRTGHTKLPLRRNLRTATTDDLVRLVFCGDIMVKNHDRVPRLHESVASVIRSADLFVGTLEAPLSELPCNPKTRYVGDKWALPLFNMPFEFLNAILRQTHLANAQVCISIASNHVADQGRVGFERTVGLLKEAGIHAIGIFNPPDPPITTIEVRGLKLGFVAWTEWMNIEPFSEAAPGIMRRRHVTEFNWKHIARDLQIDALIAVPHWDYEMCTTPSPENREIARRLLTDEGFSIVCGSHPHIIQTAEIINGGFCQYSLSNLTYTLKELSTRGNSWMTSLNLLCATTLDARTGALVGYELHPFVELQQADCTELCLLSAYTGADRQQFDKMLSGVFDTATL